MRSFAIAATVVAAASVAVADNTPSATVNNHCDFPVYLWSVADTQGPCQTLQPGGTWSEPYQTRSDGGGCSVKISPKDDIFGNITQFEYTYTPGSIFGGIFYDISNINGAPFEDVLTQIVPNSNIGQGSCAQVNCPKNQEGGCKEAYQVWNDDFATHTCPEDTSLTFNVCDPKGSSGSSNSGSIGGIVSGLLGGGSSSAAPAKSSAAAVQYSQAATTQAPAATSVAAHAQVASPAPTAAAQAAAPAAQNNDNVAVVTVVETVIHTEAAQATPAPASKDAFAPVWDSSNGKVVEGKIAARHANHMERHNRIARMHHARSFA